jgi:aminopeptidase N
VDSVWFKGVKTGFQHSANHALAIMFPQTINSGQQDSLTVFYRGVPPNEGFGAFTNSQQSGTAVMWTLSEPYGARDWWPCKSGLNDKADSIDILITYPAGYRSSSNGLMVNTHSANGKTTDYWKHRYPIAAYLVAMAITNYVSYEHFARAGDIMVPVRMYAYPSHADYFREPTRIAAVFLEILSSLFGPYPFARESYSQTQFGWGGGIEHQTNSFIGSNFNQLVVHELGHQWFGNKVTCASWRDIWLNEGFAQYMQFIYVEHMEPQNKVAHLDTYRKMVVNAPNGSVRVKDTTNINHIFDGRLSYAKGSFLVHMIRWRLGDALFFKALQSYLDDPALAYSTASTPDLKRNLEKISGQDFTEFFKDWYEGEGHPSYQVQWTVNKNNQVKVRLHQTSSHPSVSFFEMPVPLQLKGDGVDTIVTLNHTQNGQEFWLDPGFLVNTIVFDPELWLLSDGNAVTKAPAGSDRNNDIAVFPNPVPGRFHISVKNPNVKSLSIQMFNPAGQLVYRKEATLAARDEVIEIPSAHLSRGVYLVRIQAEGINIVKQLVK